jgi:hypothetical protein
MLGAALTAGLRLGVKIELDWAFRMVWMVLVSLSVTIAPSLAQVPEPVGADHPMAFGGAVRRPISDRTELVVEVVVDTYRNRSAIVVEVAPTRDDSGVGGAAVFPVSPTVQLGKGPAPSSLGGGFDRGPGLQVLTGLARARSRASSARLRRTPHR